MSRKEKLESKQDMVAEVSPEFAAALEQTALLGCKRGRGAFMVKRSYKRQKTSLEKQEEEEAELLR